ncbi:MAG: hypothetical protein ACLPYB_13040 [Desulfobaccales bacterium]
MRQIFSHEQSRQTGALSGLRARVRHPGAPFLLLLLIPVLLGWSWKEANGITIDPSFVERVQDGKTTKQEILLYFGDPKEIEHSSDGLVYKYFSYKDAPAMPYRPELRQPQEQSTSDYLLEDTKQIKKPAVKTEGKILRSTLVIRFKPDNVTVMSHEYKEF